MRKKAYFFFCAWIGICIMLSLSLVSCKKSPEKSAEPETEMQAGKKETAQERDDRMTWWREARFGLFIHWGLYAIPAGEWKDRTNHAEWILTTAQIPVTEYEKFAPRFNPVKFAPEEWVRSAKNAGMKYIVITSKHHDGFCLFDSRKTDYDVMDATPFKRDILKELADECRKQGIKMCWYHSIMDWHHPDYLPRRNWESRSAEGADFDRYVEYMKGQVNELLTNYGEIGVMWFDGEWEYTWTRERGIDLYAYVRSIAPDIIINNRVGKGRAGMAGTYDPESASGDFGTPEQEIPATGLGYDWETCMTMNDHWGYNKNDHNWKSIEDLIQKLVDIASKGGNFLLNVSPTAEGLFPQESIDRLKAMGEWMRVNSDSIYGTSASQFEHLDWGRSTTKGHILYLHVFDWPEDNKLVVPGLVSKAQKIYSLADPQTELSCDYQAGTAVISLPESSLDPYVSVYALEFSGKPEVVRSPKISSESDIFHRDLKVTLSCSLEVAEIRYTLDGSHPTTDSPVYRDVIRLDDTTLVKAQVFRDGQAVSGVVEKQYKKIPPRPAEKSAGRTPGLEYAYYQGDWERLPDYSALLPEIQGTTEKFDLSPSAQKEYFGIRYKGYIHVPEDGLYRFYVASDDGSRLYIGDELVVDNDGLHGPTEIMGRIILEKGKHPIHVEFFQRTGGVDFEVAYSGPGITKQPVPAAILFH
ncbi:MAG: alpha-L-fucosidase [Candidatus Aminicenantes bacterium]|nr:MAG: alpha-L-fucosidase [Candidatus Aminicenantes bacterium]